MAITTADGWFAAAKQQLSIRKTTSVAATAAQPTSLFAVAGNPGAGSLSIGNTSSGVIFDDTTAGAPLITNFGGGATGYLAAAQYRGSVSGGLILYDRIFGVGSISTAALATTTLASQPSITGRIPGGTDYGNLEILLEVNAANGATATTVTVNYTNEAGVTGRTTGASAALTSFAANRMVPMPLQAGDKGVRTIESVTVGGATGTMTFNVIIARRLAEFDARVANGADLQAWDALGGPQVFNSSCLWLVSVPDATGTGAPTLGLSIING